MAEESIGRKGRCKQCGHVFRLEASVAEVVPPPIAGGHSAGDTDLRQMSRDTAGPVVAKATGNCLSRIGRFEVRRKLGLGAFGTVYLAYDPTMNREVALKVPHPGRIEDEKGKSRVLREAQAATPPQYRANL
jgi:hypothetical protein